MKAAPVSIPGLLLLEPKIHRDERGFFLERYRQDALAEIGIKESFVQDNHSRSMPGVLRGLHYQTNQGKLVSVVRGRIWDVAVDLRKNSSTYGKYYAVELNEENASMLWIPAGFAHGFYVLGNEPADVLYKVTVPYNPSHEGGVRWDDPKLKISWPIKNPLVSARDKQLTDFTKIQPL